MSHRLQIIANRIVEKPSSSQPKQLPEVYIVVSKRTPIGSYMGQLSSFKGSQLAGLCIKSALKQLSLDPKKIQQVILGNVLSAGMGQAPAKQAAIYGGLDIKATCTTINKVCASGMKSIVYGTQSIQLGHSSIVLVGGFESMSNAPHLVMNARKGIGHGDKTLVDSLVTDGLTDPFKHISMGLCAQKISKQMKITREDQDQYCKMTYERHIQAVKNNYLQQEITPIQIQKKDKRQIISKDEQIQRYKPQMINKLKPSFDKHGTITAANSSKISDGASIMILMTIQQVKQNNIQPLAKIISYADAEIQATDFCMSPYYSTKSALKKAKLTIEDIDYFQFNQAFSVVPILMMRMLQIPKQKMNVMGGAVAVGHPLGASGARIVQSLITTLKLKKARYGLAGICNGGGGSTAIIIQNV